MKTTVNLVLTLIFVFTSISSFAQHRDKLHVPASKGDLTAVKKMIEDGAKVDKKDIAGQTPLMYAAEGGSLEVVTYLVEKGADVNAMSGKKGRGTALIYAAAAGKTDVVKYLLENGANVDATTPYQKETALVWATAMGHKRIVEILLENNADVGLKNRAGETAIETAKKLGKTEILKLLESK